MEKQEIIDNMLKDLYYNIESPAAFSGVNKLRFALKQKGLKVPISYIKKWLKKQQIYTMYKPVLSKRIKSKSIVANFINDIWDVDLADISSLSADNDGVKYLLTAIDVLSRKIFVYPLKNKQAASVLAGLTELFRINGTPSKLRSDRGSEFTAREIQNALKPLLKQYFATGPQKAAYAESAIKQLKRIIFEYNKKRDNERYIDDLDKIVNGINKSYHSAIETAPNLVNKDNELEIWGKLYLNKKKIPTDVIKPFKFNIGDFVKTPLKKREITQRKLLG